MKASIIILNYKSAGLVKQCLRGIVNVQPKVDYEIIVVDNNSNDGVLKMTQSLLRHPEDFGIQKHLPLDKEFKLPPFLTLQIGKNKGFAYGNNRGIELAKGEYVIILNPDIAFEPDALEKMLDYLDAHPEIGILGPKLENPNGSVQYSCRRFPGLLTPLFRRTSFGKINRAKREVSRYLMQDFDQQEIMEVDWLFGACLVIRKSVLDKIGLFDERFFMYFEDLDLCRRTWEAGYSVVYYPKVSLIHYHQQYSARKNGFFGILSKGGRIHVMSGIKYFSKYRNSSLPR